MEDFATYILEEENLSQKMLITYYLSKKTGIFFDKSIVLKAEIAKMFTSSHILQKRLLNPNVLKYSAPSFAKVSNFPIFCAFSIFLQLHSSIAVNTRFLSTFICIYSINIFAISAFNTIDLSKNIPVFFDK